MLNDKTSEYWFMISTHDSESANSLLAINGHADIIIYHFHQAVEKNIKRLLHKRRYFVSVYS